MTFVLASQLAEGMNRESSPEISRPLQRKMAPEAAVRARERLSHTSSSCHKLTFGIMCRLGAMLLWGPLLRTRSLHFISVAVVPDSF